MSFHVANNLEIAPLVRMTLMQIDSDSDPWSTISAGVRIGIRYSVFGIRYSVFGIRYSVFGIRYSVFGIRCSVFGVRYSVDFSPAGTGILGEL
jgi:hypothetical protein